MNDVNIQNLTGKFLIAVPGLKDPNFERTVVLICDHCNDGAFGLIINRILYNSFMPSLGWLDIRESLVDLPVFYGGPVNSEQGYMLYVPEHRNYASISIGNRLALTTEKEILVDVAAGRGPGRFLFTLGYAGWFAGQLEYELMQGSWLLAPVNNHVVFDIPMGERWKTAAELIGVDLDRFFHRQGRV